MRRITVALVAALLMTSLVACGSKAKTDSNGVAYSASNCPTANLETLPSAKIAADFGIIYVAFDKFIYKPYQADHLKGVGAKVKAAAAAAAIYHFAKKVKQHVINSSALCSKIGAPISDLTDKLANLPTLIKDAVQGGSSIAAVKSGMDSLPGLASSAGLPNLDLKNGVSSLSSLAGMN
ncbi:MAG TPA: hypothetical protein VFA96_05010 [Nocardioides sp.]|nr:hypothetical protein [Nocardioides sp.]